MCPEWMHEVRQNLYRRDCIFQLTTAPCRCTRTASIQPTAGEDCQHRCRTFTSNYIGHGPVSDMHQRSDSCPKFRLQAIPVTVLTYFGTFYVKGKVFPLQARL